MWKINKFKSSKGLMLLKISFILTVLIAFGFFVFNFVLPVLATHTTTVSVSPQYVAGGITDTYIFMITNDGVDSIYKITVNIPTDSTFSIDTNTISCPSGWSKDASSTSSKAVCITDPFGADVLISGNSVNVSFYATSPTLTEDTEYSWSVVTKDLDAGYEYTNTEATTIVDVTPPTTTDDAPGVNNWQTTSPVTVALTCTDANSGCANTYYCVDQVNTCTPATPGTSVSVSDEGVSYVRYYSVDNVGNTESVKSGQVWIDTVPPDATVVINGNATYTNSVDVTLTLTYSDGTSGIDKCRYKNEVGDWTEWETCADTKTWTLTSGDGEKTVYYEVRDYATNVGSDSDSIILDTTPPVVGTITVVPTIEGSELYTNANPTVTANITDEGGSGVASCKWILDDVYDGGPWEGHGEWNSETGICTAYPQLPESPLEEGHTYSFNIKGIDSAGNEGEGTPVERTIDAIPPTITNANLEPLVEESKWGKGTLTASADVSDTVAGVKSVIFTIINDADPDISKYCEGNLVSGDKKHGKWSCEINTLEPLPDGVYDFKVEASDNAENLADSFFDKFFILDNTPPTTTKVVNGPKYEEYLTTQTQITLTADDGDGIGVEKVCYKINDGNEICSDSGVNTVSFTFAEESEHLLTFWSVDKLGNVETPTNQTHYVDSSPPKTTKTYGEPYYKKDYFEWINSSTPIYLDAIDCGYAKDCEEHPVGVHETWFTILVSCVSDEEGCEIEWYGEITGEWYEDFDTCAEENEEDGDILCEEVWWKIKFLEEYSDWQQDDGWILYSSQDIGGTGPFVIPQESWHKICYFSIDKLGNEEEIYCQDVYVDNTPPVIEKEVGDPKIPDEGFTWITQNTPIELSCQDPEPHPVNQEKIWYRYYFCEEEPPENGWSEYLIDKIHFPQDSCHILEYYCEDGLGNTDGVHTQIYIVDTTSPNTTKSYDGPNVPGEFYDEDILVRFHWITSDTLINLNAVDPEPHSVGVHETWYRVFGISSEVTEYVEWYGNDTGLLYETKDDCLTENEVCVQAPVYWYPKTEWTLYWSQDNSGTGPFKIEQESFHKICYYSVDKLGNKEMTRCQLVAIDNTPPILTKEVGDPKIVTEECGNGIGWSEPGIGQPYCDIVDCCSWYQTAHIHDLGSVLPSGDVYLEYTPGKYDGCTDTATFYYSTDGTTWTEFYSTLTISVDTCPPNKCWKKYDTTQLVPGDFRYIKIEIPNCYNDYSSVSYQYLYITNSTPITLTCEDPVTGEHPPVNNVEIWYRYEVLSDDDELINETDWTLYENTIYFNEDSYHYLEYYCKDALGNSDGTQEYPHSQWLAVDITPPESYIDSPEIATAEANEVQVEFEVCWYGDDNKVGIEKFDLWVKDGENPWAAWTPLDEEITESGCADYLGTIGHTYCFKSRATDYLGNYEQDKEVGDEGVSCTDVAAYSFDIHLIQGWNLISLPVVPIDTDASVVLEDLEELEGVWTYDPTNPNAIDGWLTYNPAEPGTSNLNTMTAGFGYWVEMLNDETLTVVGSIMAPGITPPQRTLIPGWNLIGYYGVDGEAEYPPEWCDEPPCEAGKFVYCALFSLVNTDTGYPRWTSIWTYYGGSFYELHYELYGGDGMDPGAGYWLAISSDLPQVMYTMSDCPW